MFLRYLLAVLALGFGWPVFARAAQPKRPLLKRKVLKEAVLADWARGAGTAKALHPKAEAGVKDGKLRLRFPGRVKDPGVLLWSGKKGALAGMDVLRAVITNEGTSRVTARFHFQDKGGAPGAPASRTVLLEPGPNTVALPLWNLIRDGGAARLDPADVARLRLSIRRQKKTAALNLARLSAQRLFEHSSEIRFFDFGEGERFDGAMPVTARTLYTKTRGFGLSGEGIRARNYQGAFALLGDQIEGQKLVFRMDLPDGEYEIQTVAFGTNWQGARFPSYKILSGGTVAVDGKITKEKFYSLEGQYYGANLRYDPARTLFEQYHRKYFAPHRFEAAVKGGALKLGFEGCGVRALWIYPKAHAKEGRAFVACSLGEADYRLWSRQARVRPHAANKNAVPSDDVERQRGYRLFARDYPFRVYPNRVPSKEELLPKEGLKIACAPNEYEPVTFCVRPLKDLGRASVAFGELTSGDKKIGAERFEVFFVKYFPQAAGGIWYEPLPSLLYPYEELPLKAGWNRQYWATLFVPPGTPEGTYRGKITFTPERGAKAEIPLAVTVYPFDLPKTKTECGMWNNGAFANHQLDAFPGNREYAQQVLEAEVRNFARHGLNGYSFPSPKAEYDRAHVKVKLDFTRFDRIAAALKKYGLRGRHLIGGVSGMITYGLMRRGFKEFSPACNRAVLQILSAIRDWTKKADVRAVAQIFDEPRETNLNPWNRNRRDSIRYLKLARKVEGLQTMVTLMGDEDGFHRPYTPLVPLMDVLATHPWAKSDNCIYLAAVEGLADYWAYNGGFGRLVHGFYLWKSKALGHWQWVYSWEVRDGLLPVVQPRLSSAAYAFPGGYLNTLKFENVREGIDDRRYLALLEAELRKAAKDAPAAAKARAFLKTLAAFLPRYPKNHGLKTGAEAGGVYNEAKSKSYFDPWRRQVAEYIAALRKKRAPRRIEPAWAMFPKRLQAKLKQVRCKLVEQGPAVDGRGGDAAWKGVPEATGFLNLARGVLAPVQTRVKIVCDGKRMYFLFRCLEPKYGELKAYAIERDGPCWQDDSVEVFLDTNRDRKTYKHLIVNCLGTVQDGDGRDPLWNGELQTAVSKDKGSWTAEFSVSLKSLGAAVPKPGTVWGMNLCRNRQPRPPETSSWAFVGHSFHNPAGFGKMVFEK